MEIKIAEFTRPPYESMLSEVLSYKFGKETLVKTVSANIRVQDVKETKQTVIDVS